MSVEGKRKSETEVGSGSSRRLTRIIPVTFGVIVALTAISYVVMLNVVDWVAIEVLSYPLQSIAPFVIITGAILTIPIIVPTVLVSMKLSR